MRMVDHGAFLLDVNANTEYLTDLAFPRTLPPSRPAWAAGAHVHTLKNHLAPTVPLVAALVRSSFGGPCRHEEGPGRWQIRRSIKSAVGDGGAGSAIFARSAMTFLSSSG